MAHTLAWTLQFRTLMILDISTSAMLMLPPQTLDIDFYQITLGQLNYQAMMSYGSFLL
jgi:hypothetical protein